MSELTIPQQIERICEDICDNYCKYAADAWDENGELTDICNNCPLNKLHYEEKHKHRVCSIIEDDCPYEIECEDCEVFCSVERAKKRLGKK